MTSTSEARKRREETLANEDVGVLHRETCLLGHDRPFVYGRSVGEPFAEFAEFCPRCGARMRGE